MIGLAAYNATIHFVPVGEDGKGSFCEFGKVTWILLIDCFPDISVQIAPVDCTEMQIGS
ncbi:MAG: hypothetical protein JWP57_2297 [Spirosoma sp.]|nr:hypothetical protein [Spirosoma sp.]